jgi:hypothetical protein
MKIHKNKTIFKGRRYGLEIYEEPLLWDVNESLGCKTLEAMGQLVLSAVNLHQGQPLCVVPLEPWLREVVLPARGVPLQLALLSFEDAAEPEAKISVRGEEIREAICEAFPGEGWVPSTAYNLLRLAQRDQREPAEKKIIALGDTVPGYDLTSIRACLWRNNYGRCISGESLDGPYFETARFLVSRPFPVAA